MGGRVSDPHDEALLAGYVLGALGPEDERAAERHLREHLPGCASCRATLEELRSVAGELALAAAPRRPPALLLPRLRRAVERRARTRRLRPASVAAGVVLAAALGGLGIVRGGPGGVAEAGLLTQLSPEHLDQALALTARTDAQAVAVGPATEVHAPGLDHFYVLGRDVPLPPPGSVYRLWLVGAAGYRYLGEFRPAPDGTVVLRIEAQPQAWDGVLVTLEPAGSAPSEPGRPMWSSAG
jgi:anti-sigma-K factor RskA